MKKICLRIALFSILCASVCVGGYILTTIPFIMWMIAGFGALSCGALLLWICSLIIGSSAYGINLTIMVVTGIVAIISGVALYIDDKFKTVANITFENIATAPVNALIFIAFTLACLVSIFVLLGRIVFGNRYDGDE